MKLITAPKSLPLIIEDEDGTDVVCRAMSDVNLVGLLEQEVATVVGVAPMSSSFSEGERQLLRLAEAYRSGALSPVFRTDELGEERELRLAPLRAALEGAQRWIVAGRAERPGPYGPESVAVLAVIREPHAACIVRVQLGEGGADASARAA